MPTDNLSAKPRRSRQVINRIPGVSGETPENSELGNDGAQYRNFQRKMAIAGWRVVFRRVCSEFADETGEVANHYPRLSAEEVDRVGACQPLRTANKRGSFIDRRGSLFGNCLPIVEQVQPRCFAIENLRRRRYGSEAPAIASSAPWGVSPLQTRGHTASHCKSSEKK